MSRPRESLAAIPCKAEARPTLVNVVMAARRVQAADAHLGAFVSTRQEKELAFGELEAGVNALVEAAVQLQCELALCSEWRDYVPIEDGLHVEGREQVQLWLTPETAEAFALTYWDARELGMALCRESWHERCALGIVDAMAKRMAERRAMCQGGMPNRQAARVAGGDGSFPGRGETAVSELSGLGARGDFQETPHPPSDPSGEPAAKVAAGDRR